MEERWKNGNVLLHEKEVIDEGPFYHGTKAELKPGDLLESGYRSNYGKRKAAKYVYLNATLDVAIWGSRTCRRERTWPYLRCQADGDHRERSQFHR